MDSLTHNSRLQSATIPPIVKFSKVDVSGSVVHWTFGDVNTDYRAYHDSAL